jgi:hypothetical protein
MARREREKMVAVPAMLSSVSSRSKSKGADNDIAVPSFILSGAPIPGHGPQVGRAARESDPAIGAPPILLIDRLAGSMIFASISGVILRWERHRTRAVGITIFAVAVNATVALAVSPLQIPGRCQW